MAKRFLYIIDPPSTLNTTRDTTLALMEEAYARGIITFACEISDMVFKDGRCYFFCAPMKLERGYTTQPSYLGEKKPMAAEEFTAIFMRKDPPVDHAFLSALFLLRTVNRKNTVVINDPDGILLANEKLFAHAIANDLLPKTLIASNLLELERFAELHQRVALKPIFGAGGAGILIMDSRDRNLRSAIELLTRSFVMPVIMQGFIADARSGDKRILLLGGEPIGAILRIPPENDNRANIHSGGRVQETILTTKDRAIAASLKPHLLDLGLHLVGIDVIAGYLTEINVTSPTCMVEIDALHPHGISLRSQVIDYVCNLIANIEQAD